MRALADETVSTCGRYPNEVFRAYSNYGIVLRNLCPRRAVEYQLGRPELHARRRGDLAGERASWAGDRGSDDPVGRFANSGVNEGSTGEFGGDFYWAGGSNHPA